MITRLVQLHYLSKLLETIFFSYFLVHIRWEMLRPWNKHDVTSQSQPDGGMDHQEQTVLRAGYRWPLTSRLFPVLSWVRQPSINLPNTDLFLRPLQLDSPFRVSWYFKSELNLKSDSDFRFVIMSRWCCNMGEKEMITIKSRDLFYSSVVF